MAYTIEIIKKHEQPISVWSGGTTTQLAIYPKDSEYASRDFIWRISSASVDAEESVFTALPGIWRLIMVIEGEMSLIHEGHHEICLKPFDQDSFSGEWITKSFGKVRDFNLMMRDGCSGSLGVISPRNGQISEIIDFYSSMPDCFSSASAAYYCIGGSVSFSIDGNPNIILDDGDLLIINPVGRRDIINISINGMDRVKACVIKAVVFNN